MKSFVTVVLFLLIIFFVSISFLISPQKLLAEEVMGIGGVAQDLRIYVEQGISYDATDQKISLPIKVVNSTGKTFDNLSLGVSLYKGEKLNDSGAVFEGMTFLGSELIKFNPVAPMENAVRTITYLHNKSIPSGNYFLEVSLMSQDGDPYSTDYTKTPIELSGGGGWVNLGKCALFYDGLLYDAGVGFPTYPAITSQIVISLANTEDAGKITSGEYYSQSKVYNRSQLGELVWTGPKEKIDLEPNKKFKVADTGELVSWKNVFSVNLAESMLPGSYFVKTAILDKNGDDVSGFCGARWVVRGASGRIGPIESQKISYKSGENYDLNVTLYGPPDDSSTSANLVATIYNKEGEKITELKKEQISLGSSPTVVSFADFQFKKRAELGRVELKLSSASGEIWDQKQLNYLESFGAPKEESKQFPAPETLGAMALILVVGALIYYFWKKKMENAVVILMLLISGGLFLAANSAQAACYPGGLSTWFSDWSTYWSGGNSNCTTGAVVLTYRVNAYAENCMNGSSLVVALNPPIPGSPPINQKAARLIWSTSDIGKYTSDYPGQSLTTTVTCNDDKNGDNCSDGDIDIDIASFATGMEKDGMAACTAKTRQSFSFGCVNAPPPPCVGTNCAGESVTVPYGTSICAGGNKVWTCAAGGGWAGPGAACACSCTGQRCDASSVTKYSGKTVCGTNLRKWACGISGLWGSWTPLPTPCDCGVCGSANGGSFVYPPEGNLCSTGNASAVATGSNYTWTCSDTEEGVVTASCSASIMVNGACGTAQGQNLSSPPTTTRCSAGSATAVTTNTAASTYTWSCDGINNGARADCSANIIVNGACGTDNGKILDSVPTNLCSAGTASAVTTNTLTYTWSCNGKNTGTNASCSANRSSYCGNGICDRSSGETSSSCPQDGCSCIPLTFRPATSSFSPNPVVKNGSYTVKCDYGSVVDSINPVVGSGSCAWTGWSGTVSNYNCTAGDLPSTFPVSCSLVAGRTSDNCAQTNSLGNITVSAICEDTKCEGTETKSTCPQDCGYPSFGLSKDNDLVVYIDSMLPDTDVRKSNSIKITATPETSFGGNVAFSLISATPAVSSLASIFSPATLTSVTTAKSSSFYVTVPNSTTPGTKQLLIKGSSGSGASLVEKTVEVFLKVIDSQYQNK